MGGFKALSSVMRHSRRNVFPSTVSNFPTNWVSAKKEVHPASSYKRLLCQLRRQLTLHTINVMWCSKRSYIRSRKASKDRGFSTLCEYLSGKQDLSLLGRDTKGLLEGPKVLEKDITIELAIKSNSFHGNS